MRGKRALSDNNIVIVGITPADAGKTHTLKSIKAVIADHPRGCGENLCPTQRVFSFGGSPPRMRGKLEFENRLPFESGITPADAGKTG